MSELKNGRFRYDAFVSYSHGDKIWVRNWLVPGLRENGLRVYIDEDFELGAPSLTEIEKAITRSRKTLIVLTPDYVESDWCRFENVLAQTLDPGARQRRVIPLMLRQCQLPPRIEMLTWVNFAGGDQPSQLGRLTAAIRKRMPARRKRNPAALSFELPTGALKLDSPLYIERGHDSVLMRSLVHEGCTAVIEGARQMGKSSLLIRALDQVRSCGCNVVDVDFQLDFDEAQLRELGAVIQSLAVLICEKLKLAVAPGEYWAAPTGEKRKLTKYLETVMFRESNQPVVFVFDEVDRIFGRTYQDDFFGLLRGWHNLRSRSPVWSRWNLVLAISTDPRRFIRDPAQSPFNVGKTIRLRELNRNEVWELNRRYGKPLGRKTEAEQLFDVIGGQPYLVQAALYALASRENSLTELLRPHEAARGPFARHLEHHRRRVTARPDLVKAFKEVLVSGSCSDYDSFAELRALGLIKGDRRSKASARCKLYEDFFKEALP